MASGYHCVNDELCDEVNLKAEHVIPFLHEKETSAWKRDDCLLVNFFSVDGARYSLVLYKRDEIFSVTWTFYNRENPERNYCVYSDGVKVSDEKFCIFYQDMVVPDGTFIDLERAAAAVLGFFEQPEKPVGSIEWQSSDKFDDWPEHVV